ncbi:MAG: hypothetical protein K6E51_14260 [Treponema sp.]|nr:hypothetical protein [Treponema sp.]
MTLYVNGEQLDVTLENEKTVGDVLRSFEESCEAAHIATIGIVLNGETISAEKFDAITTIPLADDTKIELSVVSENAIQESFKQHAQFFKELTASLQQIPMELQSGKTADAHKKITQLADGIDSFCHTASLSALFPQTYGNIQIDGKSIQDFFVEFTQLLDDFKQALEANDLVSIGDLAEYEICPRLDSLATAISFGDNK